ncbi:hypothetical protein BDK51DRAFT_31651 [Blyttiomyces helicus]|uniref:Uncharacterized protein n=1 Tax=Blyttiomyces helicus TaxID=388810 RepID=A0A4P9WBP5_9FUNG|nr:hypothetical protein BDK51DRAFT_31651 [Blyttiomyces helicus]|eukprot:RKO90049.1 hypothetical protein BDK51DRAFT_31651 [Blyttiomyces helicus]
MYLDLHLIIRKLVRTLSSLDLIHVTAGDLIPIVDCTRLVCLRLKGIHVAPNDLNAAFTPFTRAGTLPLLEEGPHLRLPTLRRVGAAGNMAVAKIASVAHDPRVLSIADLIISKQSQKITVLDISENHTCTDLMLLALRDHGVMLREIHAKDATHPTRSGWRSYLHARGQQLFAFSAERNPRCFKPDVEQRVWDYAEGVGLDVLQLEPPRAIPDSDDDYETGSCVLSPAATPPRSFVADSGRGYASISTKHSSSTRGEAGGLLESMPIRLGSMEQAQLRLRIDWWHGDRRADFFVRLKMPERVRGDGEDEEDGWVDGERRCV